MIAKKKDVLFAYIMCFPAIFVFTTFVVLPFFEGFRIGFYSWNGFSKKQWIGLKNYYNIFFDSLFWLSLKHTFIYAFAVTVFKNIIALFLASLLIKPVILKTVFRTGIYLPVTLSYVVIGVLWSWIYNPTFGLLNSLLSIFFKSKTSFPGWLSDPNIALYSVIVVDIWKWTGYHMVLYIAGLQNISRDFYEAATLDGANNIQKFFYITIPQLNSTIVVNILMSLTGAFASNFDIVNVMTGGGPMNSTEVSLTYIIKTAFQYGKIGRANAMSMILFAIIFVFSFIQLNTMTREQNYS